MKISAEDRDYIIEKVLEAEEPLNNHDVRGVLDAIDIWYLNNGFAPRITRIIMPRGGRCKECVTGYMRITC